MENLIEVLFLGYSGRVESSRIKPVLDKKDTSHPPVTYRPLVRTGSRSREPSPVEKSEKSSSSSSSYSYNRLYPRPYQGSVSREKSDSLSTIPKYTGRTSIGRDEIPRYSGRSSTSKEDSLSSRYSRNSSREDLASGSQKYINSRFLPKNTVEKSYTAHTRPSNIRTNETSRKNRELLSVLHAQQEQERLSRSSSRCSSITPDDSASKELHSESKLEVPAQPVEMETVMVITRGTSPTPVAAQSTSYLRSRRIEIAKLVEKQITRPKVRTHTMVDKEMQSDRLDDTTKTSRFAGASRISTSPWSSILDMKFSGPNTKPKILNKSESSSLDEEKQKEICDNPKSISRNNSSKSLSPSSGKSEKSKEAKKSSISSAKSKIVPPKQISNDKKQLPPQIPKCENSSKPNSLHSLQTTNKDFRKSILNMNPDGKSKKKIGRRSNSVSSAESDAADPDATDVSENLTSCKSYHTTSSKLPQKVSSEKSLPRNSRSPSSDASTSCHTSSSEDDLKTKHERIKRQSAESSRTSVAVSSADELSLDKSPKPPQSPRPKADGIKSETEAKSFLMRALAPVTNLFKVKHHGSEEKVNWMDPSSESNNEICQQSLSDDIQNSQSNIIQNIKSLSPKNSGSRLIPAKIIIHRVESSDKWMDEKSEASEQDKPNSSKQTSQQNNSLNKPVKIIVHRVESGEKPWWLDENQEQGGLLKQETNSNKPFLKHVESGEIAWWNQESGEKSDSQQDQTNSKQNSEQDATVNKPFLKRVDSGEIAWWNQESDEKSEGSRQDRSNFSKQTSQQEHAMKKPAIRHVESGEIAWWLDENAEIPEGVETYPNWVREDGTTEDGRVIYKIRKNDSGETSWWLSSSEKTDSNKNKPPTIIDTEYLEKHQIRHIDSGERSWWLNSSENISEMVHATEGSNQNQTKYAIRHQDSGEKAWWLQTNASERNKESEYEFDQEQIPLGDRASPEGLEMPREDESRQSPYDNVPTNQQRIKRPSQLSFFISKHTNIDDILGGSTQIWSPLMDRLFGYENDQNEVCTEIDAKQVIIHEAIPQRTTNQANRV